MSLRTYSSARNTFMDWPLPWSSRTLRLTSLASRAIPASTSGGLTWRSWTRGTSGLAGSKTRSTTRSSVPRGIRWGRPPGMVPAPGVAGARGGAAEVVVVGVDAGVQHRPGDAAAGGVEGAPGRVRLDGGAGGVDQ